MNFNELKKHLLAGKLNPVYTVYGNDRYLVTHAKKLFTDLAELPELNVNAYEAGTPAYEIVKACTVMPMMSKYRVVLAFGIKNVDAALSAYFASPSPDSVLVLFPSVAPSKCGLDKTTEVVKCDHLDRPLLAAWIDRAADRRFSREARDLLIAYTMGDLARIDTEVQKLLAFVGDGANVGTEQVRAMVWQDAEFRIYELTEEIANGSPDRAYEILQTLLREFDPLVMMKTLNQYFHNLLHVRISRVSEQEIMSALKLKPYPLKCMRAVAKKFSPVRLKTIVDYLADCDYRIKTGRVTSQTALDNAVLRIAAMRG